MNNNLLFKLNGKDEKTSKDTSLLELIRFKKLDPEKIVVEKNLCIIDKDNLSKEKILENDEIEIIRFVGGG